ncbi:PLDc N-terminal domain-containing protein [Microaceticoccus formicicus]|uniref:PLDc N-terminal domain-containing protein n=1 Tax=Microaceticoccus formicicus TaxID=3118105 RepID=UPI003CD05229|nr:PLD nuclease N-terminal domain-containing protein [Peptoniphilaceae bacterium AMB_02]
MGSLEILREYLPFLVPLIILEIILATTALVHVIKNSKYRFGNKIMWIVVVLLLQIIGPVVYFAFGRGDD